MLLPTVGIWKIVSCWYFSSSSSALVLLTVLALMQCPGKLGEIFPLCSTGLDQGLVMHHASFPNGLQCFFFFFSNIHSLYGNSFTLQHCLQNSKQT